MLKCRSNTNGYGLIEVLRSIVYLEEVALVKTKSKPIGVDVALAKVEEMQREPDAFKRRDMFVEFLGGAGLKLIDESKHQQPKKRYLP